TPTRMPTAVNRPCQVRRKPPISTMLGSNGSSIASTLSSAGTCPPSGRVVQSHDSGSHPQSGERGFEVGLRGNERRVPSGGLRRHDIRLRVVEQEQRGGFPTDQLAGALERRGVRLGRPEVP